MITHQYEMFKMEAHEAIDEMFGKFQTITNDLKSLGKTTPSYDKVRKILRSLPKQWRQKKLLPRSQGPNNNEAS